MINYSYRNTERIEERFNFMCDFAGHINYDLYVF